MNSKKRKERKQMITVAVAAAVLLVLIVLYFVITNTANGNDGTDTTDTLPTNIDIGTFAVADENYNDLTAIEYTYKDETVSLEYTGKKWILKDDPDFPLDEEKVFYMAQSISDYGGFRRLAYTDTSIEDYGFDEPLYDISATYTDDGDEYTNRFRVGDQNKLTGYYYFYKDGSDYVYMINNTLFTYYSYLKNDLFVSYDVPDPDLKDINALTLFTPDSGEDGIKIEIPDEPAKETEDGTIEYSAAEKIMAELFHELHLDYRHHAAYGIDGKKLADYGLDTPALTVKLDYLRYQSVATEEGTSSAQISFEDTFTVHFGDKFTVTEKDEDGKETATEKIYFMTEYSSVVYSADYAAYLAIATAAGIVK